MSEQQGGQGGQSPLTNPEMRETCFKYLGRVAAMVNELHRFLSLTDPSAMTWGEWAHVAQLIMASVSILDPGVALPQRFQAASDAKLEPPSGGVFRPKKYELN